MAEIDLCARPIFHRQPDAVEAHLTVVFAALAVSRHLQDAAGVSIRKLVRTLNPRRTVRVDVGGDPITAEQQVGACGQRTHVGTQHRLQLAGVTEAELSPLMARVAPRPLLMLLANDDNVCSTDQQILAYQAVDDPILLQIYPGTTTAFTPRRRPKRSRLSWNGSSDTSAERVVGVGWVKGFLGSRIRGTVGCSAGSRRGGREKLLGWYC